MTTTIIVDADSIAYAHASRNQESFDFGDEVGVSMNIGDLADAAEAMDAELAALKKKLKAGKMILALSCASADGWRCDVLPSYKKNRTNVKPMLLGALKDHMRARYNTFERPRMEADDICGILATHPTLVPGDKIVVSIDKDLRTIPCWLFNPQKDKAAKRVHEDEADYFHMYQTLIGDTTDGYKGLPGIGPVKAEKILRAPNGEQYGAWSMWQAIVAAFEAKKLTEDDALVQARVARICRHTDYDFKTKEVKLWTPSVS